MSFLLYARPEPRELPDPAVFLAIKGPIARVLFDSDGSMPGENIVDNKFIPVLTGMKAMAGGREAKEEIEELILIIKDNPQGVRVWIGDPDG